jgi:hypothetical protein
MKLSQCIIGDQARAGVGQLPPPNHVSDGGSFRRKQPWRPHSKIAPPEQRHEHTTTIPSRPADDPRQHARQRRAVAGRVVLAVPPSDDLERGPVAGSRAGAEAVATVAPPFQTLSQIGNVIKELPAGPAVVPPINGSVHAVGGRPENCSTSFEGPSAP